MAKVKLSEFNQYLIEQVGQPYVWGAQHLKLTESNYIALITRKESDPTYRASAIAYCKNLFDSGTTVLYAYDCSGLGMYYLQNVKKVYSHDMSANGMMGLCDMTETPKRGDWLFLVNEDGKATHIGYMVSDTELVEARGRTYGVVRRRYVKRDWHRIGKASCLEWDEPKPSTHEYVKVRGGSVRVRSGNGTMFPSIGIAHRGDLLPCYGQADADPYWYEVDYKGQRGFITCYERYTTLVQK